MVEWISEGMKEWMNEWMKEGVDEYYRKNKGEDLIGLGRHFKLYWGYTY